MQERRVGGTRLSNQGQCVSFYAHGGQASTTISISTSTGTSTSTTTTTLAQTTLSISRTGPTGAFPNQEFNFTITVTNTGSATAAGVSVVDTLPSAGTFVSSTPAGSPAAPAPGSTYTVGVPNIAPGGIQTVTLRWKAPGTAGTVFNSAAVTATDAPTAGPATSSVPVGISSTCSPCGAVAAGTGLRNRDLGAC